MWQLSGNLIKRNVICMLTRRLITEALIQDSRRTHYIFCGFCVCAMSADLPFHTDQIQSYIVFKFWEQISIWKQKRDVVPIGVCVCVCTSKQIYVCGKMGFSRQYTCSCSMIAMGGFSCMRCVFRYREYHWGPAENILQAQLLNIRVIWLIWYKRTSNKIYVCLLLLTDQLVIRAIKYVYEI